MGAWHVPLDARLNAVVGAGLVLGRVAESGPGPIPDVLGLTATGPG
ncbi:hypothetical protein [Micromonospora sp. DT47]